MDTKEEFGENRSSWKRLIVIALSGALVILLMFWGAINALKKKPIQHTVQTYTIYASAPLKYEIGKFPINGAELAFDEALTKPRPYILRFVTLDDSSTDGNWDEMRLRANVHDAVSEPTTIAFFGPIYSTEAKIAIPILNVADIPEISPTNSWPGLTKLGFSVDEPGRYYPTQKRNYVRFSTTDELELTNAASWAKALGVKNVSITGDKSLDPATTIFFSKRAEELGIKVNSRTFLESETSLNSAQQIAAEKPDLVYHLGANSTLFTKFIIELRKAGYNGKIMVSDSVLSQSLFADAKKEMEGVYVTSVNIPIEHLENAAAGRFIDAYHSRFKIAPDPAAGMGYESMRILIDAIDRSDKTRDGVIKALFATKDFPTMFGPVSIDSNGDNVNGNIGGSIVHNGAMQFIGIIGRTPNLTSQQ